MFSNCPRMIKTDLNMSELWQIVCKECIFNIGAFVGFIVWVDPFPHETMSQVELLRWFWYVFEHIFLQAHLTD